MASAVAAAPTTPETLITIKVFYEGCNRKFKLPLKDLAVAIFPIKLRHILHVPANHLIQIERFSDSSSAYVALDPSNTGSYKQLYRAAKAKLKLRIKVTAIDPAATIVAKAMNGDASASTHEKSTLIVGAGGDNNSTISRDADAVPITTTDANSHVPSACQRVLPAHCSWQVCCNSCDQAMADVHYHCSICDHGDYDLCESCVQAGKLCPGEGHWLIKRTIKDGHVLNSTTFKFHRNSLESGQKSEQKPATSTQQAGLSLGDATPSFRLERGDATSLTRTCNSCVRVLPERLCVTCLQCDDYDLCLACHAQKKHGHHPAHAFEPTTTETHMSAYTKALCAAGRNVRHAAICDGCNKTIFGVRNKCLDCPDWDLCGSCISTVPHQGHRFVPIYEPLEVPSQVKTRHYGIYCDGPLCNGKPFQSYIEGARFKCAVCHDTDFCANCEAHPDNQHNHTHPLIKFKTPVRGAVVSTTHYDGKQATPVAVVGDQPEKSASTVVPKEATPCPPPYLSSEQAPAVSPSSSEKVTEPAAEAALDAQFMCDTVPDGSQLTPGIKFAQTWTIRNPGPASWPVGCHVRHTGGDNMFGMDALHPVSKSDSTESSESNATDRVIAPGETFDFSVSLRVPIREGKYISYWRVKDPKGAAFGHKLWCDVVARRPTTGEEMQRLAQQYRSRQMLVHREQRMNQQRAKLIEDLEVIRKTTFQNTPLGPVLVQHEIVPAFEESDVPPFNSNGKDELNDEEAAKLEGSQMVFPTLEKESPVSSTHEDKPATGEANAETLKPAAANVVPSETDAVTETDTVGHNEEVFEDVTSIDLSDSDKDDGFLTDEEYDLLDASDEEHLD